MNLVSRLVLVVISLGWIHCGSSSSATSTGNPVSFPSSLAIVSPTSNSSSSSTSSLKLLTSYEVETSAINTILNATSLSDCVSSFFADLTATATNAACYGPGVDYTNHPDGGAGSNGSLPTGDVGMWTEVEGSTTEACAAAQLNTRMESVSDKTTIALKTLASMICTINNTSTLSLPSAGSSVTLTTEMNTMLAATSLSPAPTVNSATLSAASNSVGTTDYTYAINVTYTVTDPSDSTSTISVALQTNMTHRPLDSTNSTYLGKFSYYFNSDDTQGNCNRDFGSSSTSDITELGSVTYERASSTSMRFESRFAQSCGDDNATALDSDNILDPSDKALTSNDAGGPNTDGWAANFTILRADFDPADNQGKYFFAWQAGVGDGTARTFNVLLEDDDSDNLIDGVAFFGFGAEIASSSVGSISGIYCNWAGPSGGVGNDTSKRQDLAQRQAIENNSTTNVFEVVSSNTTYAPTLNCNYDGTGSFTYDSNGDGTIDTSASTAVTNNLVDPSDTTSGISASGYTAPTAPSSL